MKLLQNVFCSITISLFMDDDGKLWELTQQSDGRYHWFPIFEDELEGWPKDRAGEVFRGGLLSGKTGNLSNGMQPLPVYTHAQRKADER